MHAEGTRVRSMLSVCMPLCMHALCMHALCLHAPLHTCSLSACPSACMLSACMLSACMALAYPHRGIGAWTRGVSAALCMRAALHACGSACQWWPPDPNAINALPNLPGLHSKLGRNHSLVCVEHVELHPQLAVVLNWLQSRASNNREPISRDASTVYIKLLIILKGAEGREGVGLDGVGFRGIYGYRPNKSWGEKHDRSGVG